MSTATDMLAAYLAAETALLTGGREVRLGDRWLVRANLPEIVAGREKWQAAVADEQRKAATGSGLNLSIGIFSDHGRRFP